MASRPLSANSCPRSHILQGSFAKLLLRRTLPLNQSKSGLSVICWRIFYTHISQFVIQLLYCCQFATSQKAEIISVLYTTGFPAPTECLIHKRRSVAEGMEGGWHFLTLDLIRVLGRFSVLQKDSFSPALR